MNASTKQLPREETERAETTALRDRTFETLSNPRRRQALRYLRTHEEDSPVVIRDLAEQIAAWENDIPIVEVTYKQRKRVYTSLYQSHLPKLHNYGFIDYDSDRGTIELTPQAEQLDVYLEVVPEGSLPWSDVYLGTSVVAVVLVAVFYVGAIPFLQSWHLLGLFVVLFSGISLVHSVATRRNTLYE
jgi:DNA-binding transcriptional ArsR family regulator